MEKFALLNLIKALQSLSPQNQNQTDGGDTRQAQTDNKQKTSQPNTSDASAEHIDPYPNVMASVLERHEAIANRVKNKH